MVFVLDGGKGSILKPHRFCAVARSFLPAAMAEAQLCFTADFCFLASRKERSGVVAF